MRTRINRQRGNRSLANSARQSAMRYNNREGGYDAEYRGRSAEHMQPDREAMYNSYWNTGYSGYNRYDPDEYDRDLFDDNYDEEVEDAYHDFNDYYNDDYDWNEESIGYREENTYNRILSGRSRRNNFSGGGHSFASSSANRLGRAARKGGRNASGHSGR